MSKAPFDMPGHYWDPTKQRFFKQKPKSSSSSIASASALAPSRSVSDSDSIFGYDQLGKSDSKKGKNRDRPVRSEPRSRSISSQILNLRRSYRLDSSIRSKFKDALIRSYVSSLTLTHQDTLPLQVGRHPITYFSDVLEAEEESDIGEQGLLHVGDTSGALWQIPTSFSANSRRLSLPILQPDENGDLYSSRHTSMTASAAFLTHDILNPPMDSIKSNHDLVAFLDSKGFRLFSRTPKQRKRLEPLRLADQVLVSDRFEIRCFDLLRIQTSSESSDPARHLLAVGGDHRVQIALISGPDTYKFKSEIHSIEQQIMCLEILDQEHLLLGTRSGEIHLWRLALGGKRGVKIVSREPLEIRGTVEVESFVKADDQWMEPQAKGVRSPRGTSRTERDRTRSRGSIVHLKKVDNGISSVHGREVVVSWTTGKMCLLVLRLSLPLAAAGPFGSPTYNLAVKTSFEGHSNSHLFHLGLALDSRSRILAVAGSDRRVRLWRLDSPGSLEMIRKAPRSHRDELKWLNRPQDEEMQIDGIKSTSFGLAMGSSLASIIFCQPIQALAFIDRSGVKGGIPMLAVGDRNQILYFQ